MDSIPQQPQRQDALSDQLDDLVIVAHRFGMYDAADWLFQISPRPLASEPCPVINSIPRHDVRQDSLEDQLNDLTVAANRLGMYDATDWVNRLRRY